MKTFASVAAMSVMLAGAALAQSGTGDTNQTGLEQARSGADHRSPTEGASSDIGVQSPQSGANQTDASRDRRGDSVVSQVQERLKREGYAVGAIDGKFGPQTRAAVEQFQRDRGHDATGQLDESLLAEMGIEADTQQAANPEDDAAPAAPMNSDQPAEGGALTR